MSIIDKTTALHLFNTMNQKQMYSESDVALILGLSDRELRNAHNTQVVAKAKGETLEKNTLEAMPSHYVGCQRYYNYEDLLSFILA